MDGSARRPRTRRKDRQPLPSQRKTQRTLAGALPIPTYDRKGSFDQVRALDTQRQAAPEGKVYGRPVLSKGAMQSALRTAAAPTVNRPFDCGWLPTPDHSSYCLVEPIP